MDVLIHGDGLKGNQVFDLKPKTANNYELMFLPLRTGVSGGMITFLNEELGEIWYEIVMTSEPSSYIRLNP